MVVRLWTADSQVTGSNPGLGMAFHYRNIMHFTKTGITSKRLDVGRRDRYHLKADDQLFPTRYYKSGFAKGFYA